MADEAQDLMDKMIKFAFSATNNHLKQNGVGPLAGAYVGIMIATEFMRMVPVDEMAPLDWVSEFENFKKILDRHRNESAHLRPGAIVN